MEWTNQSSGFFNLPRLINNLADGKVYAGMYYYMGNKVCTLYIPRIVQPEVTAHPNHANVPNGETWEGFLGQASNIMD
jgi:hypothetical protein